MEGEGALLSSSRARLAGRVDSSARSDIFKDVRNVVSGVAKNKNALLDSKLQKSSGGVFREDCARGESFGEQALLTT